MTGTRAAVPFRALGLDLLRGMAIIGMVLASLIPYDSNWPGWMYHAQVGPPTFSFNPDKPGITWVDLVFPFFLFSMGAAFPLALRGKLERNQYLLLFQGILKRGVLLLFFALALAYLTPGNLKAGSTLNWLTALATFGCFFLLFTPHKGSKLRGYLLQLAGFVAVAALVWAHHRYTGNVFSLWKSNIIILVLANMAVFGSLVWVLTSSNWLLRMGVLALFAGVWLTHDLPGSWTAHLWEFHPSAAWFYQFSFLKYLGVVLPGSILGDLLLNYRKEAEGRFEESDYRAAWSIALVSLLFVVLNVYTLYARELVANLAGNALLGVAGFFIVRNAGTGKLMLYRRLFQWGFFFIVLGVFFEPFEGGIKKDPSSFSYWFLTSGLAFLAYLICDGIATAGRHNAVALALIRCGQNPMIAYAAGAFLVMPALGLLHILPLLDGLKQYHALLALVRTAVILALVVTVTAYATKRKWFWKS